MKQMYRWINLLGLVIVLIVNLLAEQLPLGGKTTGQISAEYPVLIAPAGYAFSIWSVIYVLLIGFVIYGFTKRGRSSIVVESIGIWFFLSCLFNATWLFAWHYEKISSSVFVMFGLLLTLVAIYIRVNNQRIQSLTMAERLLVRLPFRIYLGWICVATIVNVATALYAIEWDGFGWSDITWTVVMLVVATLLSISLGLKYRDPASVLVFVWALIAICYQQQEYPAIAYTSLASAIVLLILALFLIINNKRNYVSR